MCISVNIKATFQVLQLLTQKLQHNFRCAKKISVMSCRYGKGKDESRSTAIPPLHAVVVQSDNVHFLQDKFHWCPILSYLRTCPHREEQKKGLTLFLQYLRLPAPEFTMKPEQPSQQLAVRCPEKCSSMHLDCESRRNPEPQESSMLSACGCCNYERYCSSRRAF